jgi:8-oxo-dGTP pyrophosphatase MutT (NUDIX family)
MAISGGVHDGFGVPAPCGLDAGRRQHGSGVVADWTGEGETSPWRVTHTRTAYENPWMRVEHNTVIHPGGREGVYGVVRIVRLAVGVLPIEPDGRVHLVGQWRFPLGRYSWEMPEGGAEPGESAEACAIRELQEEAGLRAGRLEQILELDMSNSLTDEEAVVFLASDLTAVAAAPEDTEVLRRRCEPFMALLDAVADGHVRDSLTVAAALRAHHMAVTGALPADLARAMLSR